jgi:hypothetical protein
LRSNASFNCAEKNPAMYVGASGNVKKLSSRMLSTRVTVRPPPPVKSPSSVARVPSRSGGVLKAAIWPG